MSLEQTLGRYDIAAQEDRSAPRTKLAIPAQLRASGARAFQTVVNDLSLSGFTAAHAKLEPGSADAGAVTRFARPRHLASLRGICGRRQAQSGNASRRPA